jgi:hypothetical protein
MLEKRRRNPDGASSPGFQSAAGIRRELAEMRPMRSLTAIKFRGNRLVILLLWGYVAWPYKHR